MPVQAPFQSERMQKLQKLADRMPPSTQAANTAMQSGVAASMQQAVAQAPQQATPQQVQGLGTQVAAQQGANQLQVAQQAQQTTSQVGRMGLQEQGRANQEVLANKALSIAKKQRELEQKLFNISEEAKDKLLDQNLTFQKDELGRTNFNERQLADWAILKAKNSEDFANYEQGAQQASKKRMSMLQIAQKKLESGLAQGFQSGDAVKDMETKKKMAEAKMNIQRKINEEKAKQRNRAQMISGAGMVVGGVAGAFIGGPAGAMAGTSLGGGLGSMAAGATA